MVKKGTIRISLECSYDQWWRYNVYVSAATFRDGDKVDYQSLTDSVYPLGNGSEVRLRPEGYDSQRPLALEVEAAETLELFVYIIPNTMPVADSITQSPPFPIRLKVKGAGLAVREELLVNQWGGVSVHRSF